MQKTLSKLLYFLDARERLYALGLLVMIVIGALLEMLGIGLIYPFIVLLNSPALIEEQEILRRFYVLVGQPEYQTFLIWVASGIIVAFVLKNVFLALTSYLQFRFVSEQLIEISSKLFDAYLHSPYPFHLQRNSAELLRNVDSEIRTLISGIFISGLLLFKHATVIIAVTALLLFIQPLPTFFAILILGLLAYGYNAIFRQKLTEQGEKRIKYRKELIKQVQEGLGASKELIILGRQGHFLDRFLSQVRPYTYAHLFRTIVNELSRYALETIAVVGILVVIVTMLWQGSDLSVILPSLSVFAAAAIRLLPSMNNMALQFNEIRFSLASIDVVYADFVELGEPGGGPLKRRRAEAYQPLPPFADCIELVDVSYQYQGSNEFALKDVSFQIKQGQVVGFVGPSGAGKTSAIDVLLGLLKPTSGRVLVDGFDIQNNLRGWQDNLGYIPQDIYLIDDSLRRNIAFGIPESEIDEDRVRTAVRSAQLEDWMATLPDGLDTIVGEKGVRISGGQRQRVGIARALYHNPDILVMDEATASLDNRTEAGIMHAVEKLGGEKTIIIIAHRLTTVENCDRLFFLEDGRLVDTGTYEELRYRSEAFQDMAGIMGS